MMHIKKFENINNLDDDNIEESKSILKDLTDEYPEIKIAISKYNGGGFRIFINTENIFPQRSKYLIENIKIKMDFINKLLDILSRIEKSIDVICNVLNIFEVGTSDSIQIDFY